MVWRKTTDTIRLHINTALGEEPRHREVQRVNHAMHRQNRQQMSVLGWRSSSGDPVGPKMNSRDNIISWEIGAPGRQVAIQRQHGVVRDSIMVLCHLCTQPAMPRTYSPHPLLTLVSSFSFKMSVLFPPLITLCLSSATSSSSSKTGSLAGSAILEEGAQAGLCRACSYHHTVLLAQLSFLFPHFYSFGLLSSESNLKIVRVRTLGRKVKHF